MSSSDNSTPGTSKGSGSPKKNRKTESPSRNSKPSTGKGDNTPSKSPKSSSQGEEPRPSPPSRPRTSSGSRSERSSPRSSKARSSQREETPSSSSPPSTTSGSRSENSSPRYSKPSNLTTFRYSKPDTSKVEGKPFTSLKPDPSKGASPPLQHLKNIASRVERITTRTQARAFPYCVRPTISKGQGISPSDVRQPISFFENRQFFPNPSSLSSDQSLMNSPKTSNPGSIKSLSYHHPKPRTHNKGQQANIRACKVCHVIKEFGKFFIEGCDNCEEVLSLKGNLLKADLCTSSDFDEPYEKERNESIFIEQWHRVCDLKKGRYAKYVRGIIPAEVLADLAAKGYVYDVDRDLEETRAGRL